MMSRKRIWTAAAFALSVLAGGLTATAQEGQDYRPGVRVGSDVLVTRTRTPQGPLPGAEVVIEGAPGHGDTFVFVSSEMSIDGKVVKGAPYSAQAVTEMIQTLADGNRIVRKNTANVYRDSEGRTRRDQTLGAIGPFAAQGDPPQTVFINDPVANVNYILDPRTRTARKLQRFEYKIEFGSDEFKEELKAREKAEKDAAEQPKVRLREAETHGFTFRTPGPLEGGADVRFFSHSSKADVKTEKLDKQTVEGVLAEGTRTTLTIPAGEIGNEQPIQIVTERWYSPELQTVVMTRHSDPRSGENIYRLTNISRTEPAATLFQVPGDYAVKSVPQGPLVRKMRSTVKPGDHQ